MKKEKQEQKENVLVNRILKPNLKASSPYMHLFYLREAVDLAAMGKCIDMDTVNNCYEELLLMTNEYLAMMASIQSMTRMMNAQQELKESNEDESASSEEKIFEAFENEPLLEAAKAVYGDYYDRLQDGLDELNIKNKTLYEIYIVVNKEKKRVQLKIFDEKEADVKRVYDDLGDLKANLEADLRTNFSREKTPGIAKYVEPLKLKKEGGKKDEDENGNIDLSVFPI